MSDQGSYWRARRLTRRDAVRSAAVLGGGLAALSLAGCGGSDDASSSAVKQDVIDSTKGKPGGALKVYIQNYPGNFSPLYTNNTWFALGFVHSALLQHAWGVQAVDAFDFYNYEPDVARALPEQPDENTFVFKIRPGIKFHNGRALTVEDVKYSIDKVARDDKSVHRQRIEYFLDRVETPDAETVVVKMKFPFADGLVAFAGNQFGYMLAKEHQEGPNHESSMMGVGPYQFVSTTAPVATYYKRNPDYYIKPYPYFDTIEAFTTTDATKRVADFVARQVHLPFRSSTEEAAQIRKERPDAKEYTWEFASPSLTYRADKPPFNDKRVRQAMSMAVNRKKIRDAVTSGFGRDDQFFTVSFQKLFGFRAPKDLPAAQAKLWEYNPTAAKQLLSAAGITSPIENTMLNYGAGPSGQWFADIATLLQTDYRELGIANIKNDERPQAVYTMLKTTYDGTSLSPNNGFPLGPEFTVAIKNALYWDPVTGKPIDNQGYVNNPQINALVDKQLRQLKLEDRKATYKEMEPMLAEEAYINCMSTVTRSYFWDPSLANANMSVVQGSWQYMKKWWFA